MHTLKGASATFGATTLSALAHDLEKMTTQEILADAEKSLAAIEAEYARTKTTLDTIRGSFTKIIELPR